MHTFTRKAVTEDNPRFLPECYSHSPESAKGHAECSECKILDICKAARDIPILTYEPYHEIVNKVETFGEGPEVESFYCKNSQDFVFHDEQDKNRTYTHEEILSLLAYIFNFTPREFYYLQAKILHPEFSLEQIARPVGATRQNISKRFQEIIKARPELFSILRIRRNSATQRP